MSRKVLVISSAGSPTEITNFEGTTFGQLKQNATFANLFTANQDAIILPGEYTVTSNDTVLPEGDLEIYLVPTKNKAGVTSQALESMATRIVAALRKANEKSQDQDLSDLENAIVDDIEDFFGVDVKEDLAAQSRAAAQRANFNKFASRR